MRTKMRAFFLRAKGLHRSKFYRETLQMVSPELRKQMSAHVHGVWMDQVEFLRDVPVSEKANFSAAVAMVLVTEIYAPSEDVIKRGELTEKMYIIQKGLVARLGRVFGKGRYVGEDMILHSSRRHYYVRTLTYVDCQSLSKESLEGITDGGDFPVSKHSIRHSAIRLCLQRTIVSAARTVKGMFAFGNVAINQEMEKLDFEDIVTLSNDETLDPDEMDEEKVEQVQEELQVKRTRRASVVPASCMHNTGGDVNILVLHDTNSPKHARGGQDLAALPQASPVGDQIVAAQLRVAQQLGQCQNTLNKHIAAQDVSAQKLGNIKRQLEQALAAAESIEARTTSGTPSPGKESKTET